MWFQTIITYFKEEKMTQERERERENEMKRKESKQKVLWLCM